MSKSHQSLKKLDIHEDIFYIRERMTIKIWSLIVRLIYSDVLYYEKETDTWVVLERKNSDK